VVLIGFPELQSPLQTADGLDKGTRRPGDEVHAESPVGTWNLQFALEVVIDGKQDSNISDRSPSRKKRIFRSRSSTRFHGGDEPGDWRRL
jgi:hypothetical protein